MYSTINLMRGIVGSIMETFSDEFTHFVFATLRLPCHLYKVYTLRGCSLALDLELFFREINPNDIIHREMHKTLSQNVS